MGLEYLLLMLGIGFYVQGKVYKVSDFQGQIFKFNNMASGIYQVSVGFENFQGLLVAYADVNNDKATDVITTDVNRHDVQIQYWETSNFVQQNLCQGGACLGGTIYGVIPADYNYDGLLDLLLITKGLEGVFQGYVFYQDQNSDGPYPSFNYPTGSTFSSTIYPFVADFYGNHTMSIMIMYENVRQVLAYPFDAPIKFSSFASSEPGCLPVVNQVTYPFSMPIFNSVVDINADCRADLVIVANNSGVQMLEYWYTAKVSEDTTIGRYCLRHVETLSVVVQSLNFADINFDGLVDMVAVVNLPSSPFIQWMLVNYNNNSEISNSNLCQNSASQSSLVTNYPYSSLQIENTSYSIVTPLNNSVNYNFQMYNYSCGFANEEGFELFAPFLRFGDFTASGFPSALVNLINQTSSLGSTTYWIQNIGCDDSDACHGLKISNKRMLQFDEDPAGLNGLNAISVPATLNAAFFDYGENGRLDFLLNVKSNNNEYYTIFAFYNYLSLDAFYLKALGLNGQCSADHDQHIDCLGALYYGASYMFSVTDINGEYHPAVGVQLYQPGMSPLQLPYAYMGLGRTNNYIEDFYAGIPLKDGAIQKWTPIIPNSQLIMSPYTDDPHNWSLSIFIQPTEAILVVVIVTIIVLVLLGGVIVWKHIKEKEEDKKSTENFFQMFR